MRMTHRVQYQPRHRTVAAAISVFISFHGHRGYLFGCHDDTTQAFHEDIRENCVHVWHCVCIFLEIGLENYKVFFRSPWNARSHFRINFFKSLDQKTDCFSKKNNKKRNKSLPNHFFSILYKWLPKMHFLFCSAFIRIELRCLCSFWYKELIYKLICNSC